MWRPSLDARATSRPDGEMVIEPMGESMWKDADWLKVSDSKAEAGPWVDMTGAAALQMRYRSVVTSEHALEVWPLAEDSLAAVVDVACPSAQCVLRRSYIPHLSA